MIEPTSNSNDGQSEYEPIPYRYSEGDTIPDLNFEILEAWALRQRDNGYARHACDDLTLLWGEFAFIPHHVDFAQLFADNRYVIMQTIRLIDTLDSNGKSAYRIINRWERRHGSRKDRWRALLLWWSPFYGKATRYIKPSSYAQ